MNASDILNLDMASLSRLARQGFDWWTGELRGLMPSAFGSGGTLTAWHRYEGGEVIVAQSRRVDTLVIPRELCLVRNLTLPRMSEADLRALIALDADRIMPVAADSIVLGMRVLGPAAQADMLEVRVGALPLARAQEIAGALAEAMARGGGSAPAHLGPLDEDGRRLDFDLAPALRAAGLLPARPRVAPFWWALVGVLTLVNVGIVVLRDQHQVDAMQALVDAQSPALTAVRRIEDRLRENAGRVDALNRRRAEHQPLRLLAALDATLPSQAFIQRLEWDGSRLRLSGYARNGINVVSTLKASGAFGAVRAARAEAQSDTFSGRPFDLTATTSSALPVPPPQPGTGGPAMPKPSPSASEEGGEGE